MPSVLSRRADPAAAWARTIVSKPKVENP
jgi:hypothetical protein